VIGKTAPIVACIATARKAGAHVFGGPENERIHVLSGSPEDVLDYVRDAQDAGIKNGFIHAKIAPDHSQNLTPDQWQQVLNGWCSEFKLDPENVCAVLHEKNGHTHLHIMGPGCDPVTGRRTDVSWCHLRTEKLCRKLEADFGHNHVPMKAGHVRSVAARLRAEGRPEVADAINNCPTVEGAAFSEKQGQRLKRDGYSPAGLKRIVRACWDCSDNAQALSNALAEFGFCVSPGKRKNVWVVSSEDGTELGALDRIVDEKRATVAARLAPDKPRGRRRPAPLPLPEPLPDLPQQPHAASVIPEQKPTIQAPQEPHHEQSASPPPVAPETGSGHADLAGTVTVRINYRADIGGVRAAENRQSGRSGAGPSGGAFGRSSKALRDPAAARRCLDAVRENRNNTQQLSRENRDYSKTYREQKSSTSRLRIALLKYRAKMRGLAARFGVSVEVVRKSLSAKIAIDNKDCQQQIEYSCDQTRTP